MEVISIPEFSKFSTGMPVLSNALQRKLHSFISDSAFALLLQLSYLLVILLKRFNLLIKGRQLTVNAFKKLPSGS